MDKIQQQRKLNYTFQTNCKLDFAGDMLIFHQTGSLKNH